MGNLPGPSLRIALVGAGMISVFHLRAWQTAGVEIVAICDLNRQAAADRAYEFGIKRIYDDPALLFADGGFDVVDIATSLPGHDPLTRMATDHGVHVILQKPMTETVAQAEALIAHVGDRVRFMIHENYRFRPHYKTVQKWMGEGRIGEPRHATITVRGSGYCERPGQQPYLIERQPYLKNYPRNLVFETMIHHLDVLRLLVGPLKVIAARLNHLADGLSGEDTAVILMEGKNGLIATADGCLCAPGYPDLHGDSLEIIGTTGSLVMDYNRVFLVGAESEAEEVDLLGRYQECFDDVIVEFISGLSTGRPFETDRLDNLETLRLMESVYIAAGVEV
jgi:D-apiose dehydrogenase